jgi:hypothetical protein
MTPPSRLSYTRPLHLSLDNVPKQGVLHSSFALQIRGYPRLAPLTREAAPLFNGQVGVRVGLDAGWTTPITEGGPHPGQGNRKAGFGGIETSQIRMAEIDR